MPHPTLNPWRRVFARLQQVRLSIKLILLSTLLTAAVVCSAFLALSISIRVRTTRFFADELSRNQQALLNAQAHSAEQLLLTSALITESPTLRAAMETYRLESREDGASGAELLATIYDEARKIVASLGKDLLVVTDDRGRVLAVSGQLGEHPVVGEDLSALAAVRQSLDPSAPVNAPSFSVVNFRGQNFQVGCMPIVLRGFPIGTVILGERWDETFVRGLGQSLGGDVVVTLGRQVMASTLRPEWIESFTVALGDPIEPSPARARTVRLGRDEFVVAPLRLDHSEAGLPVVLYLLRSLPLAMTQLNRALFRNFLFYGALTVILAGIVAGAVSAKLTRANDILTEQMRERERAEKALHTSEEQLRQSQKLEAIGTLAGGIAHDFNNLLTVILSYTDLALDEIPSASSTRADLQQVKDAATRAAALTKQILAFSRKQILEPKVLDLHSVVVGVEQMLQRLIGEHIDLDTVSRTPLARVKADPGQLEQVIMNLAVNARDAMPKGGKLTIETANVRLGAEEVRQLAPMPPGSWVVLSVSDTGIGMDEATRSRVFEPFFTTKGLGKGTGLGLSTVYGIVKQSGGYIWVSSAPGEGTTFTIYLPPADEVVETPEPSSEQPEAPQGCETILLAEDEDAVRALAVRTLEKIGYVVLAARNGREALQVAERHAGRIDLILTDVVMPHMSGTELVERLTAERPAMRVLYMSGYTDGALFHDGELDPETSFLQKPFAPAALARKVRAVLSERQERSEHVLATSC